MRRQLSGLHPRAGTLAPQLGRGHVNGCDAVGRQALHDVFTTGTNYADKHHLLS